jgi:RHS repeat-associated protein
MYRILSWTDFKAAVRIATASVVLLLPGLLQITTIPAAATEIEETPLETPKQMAGGFGVLPSLVDASATQAVTEGPRASTGELPGDALGPDILGSGKTRPVPPDHPHRWIPRDGRERQLASASSTQSEAAADTPWVGPAYPEDGAQVDTLTPQLRADAYNTGTSAWWEVEREYKICEALSAGGVGACTTSPWKPWTDPYWKIPSGTLQWGKTYVWQVRARNSATGGLGGTTVYGDMYLTTGVRQPGVGSMLATQGVNGQEFHQLAGNYTTTFTDASVAAPGSVPLAVARSYNSLDRRVKGMFGAGWSSRFDMKLLSEGGTPESLLVTYPDGRQLRFMQKSGTNAYQAPPGMHFTLTKTGDGGWNLMDKSSTVYGFDPQGRLLKVADSRGRGQELTYTGGKLTKVTATGGRSLTFSWTGEHVSSVSTDPVDGASLVWTYHYDGDRLTKACAPVDEPNCTSYVYDAASRYRETILDARPVHYFRMGEVRTETWPEMGTVTCLPDEANSVGCRMFGSGVQTGQPGALAGTTNASTTFQGSGRASHFDLGPTVSKLGDQLSVESWFKTTKSGFIYWANSGGWNPSSPGYGVPGLYVGTDGRLRGQLKIAIPGESPAAPVTSPQAVNDGQWHHAVITVANNVTTLYVDGVAAGTGAMGVEEWDWVDGSVVGTGAADASIPGTPAANTQPTEFGFQGSIDEFALYDRALAPGEVRAHYDARVEAPLALSKITLPSGRTWMSTSYDPVNGRVATHTDADGGTWKVGVPVLDPTARTSTVKVTDPRQKTLEFVHDPWRGYRLVSMSDQLAKKTAYTYDTGGFLHTTLDPNGNISTYYNDERGNVLQRTTCQKTTSCQTAYFSYHWNEQNPFDAKNNLLFEQRDARSPDSHSATYRTTYEYNSFGEQTKQTTPATPDFPQGRSSTLTYTDGTEAAVGGGTMPAGLVETSTDARHNVWTKRYTAAGDLAEQVEPEGLTTKYAYDPIGRPIERIEVSEAFPNGAKTTLAYDGRGQLLRHTGAPVKNEITGKTHTVETRSTYDPDGNKLTDTVVDLTGGDPERTVTYTYDAYGREETVTGPEGGVVRTAWDNTGARTTVTNELGSVFGYTYTDRGELATETLKNWTGSPVSPEPTTEIVLGSYSYDPGGRLSAHVDAMRRKIFYTYYGDNLLQEVTAEKVKLNGADTARNVVLASYTYDSAGQLISEVTGGGKARTEYVYDAAGRLTSSTFDPAALGRKVEYAYDANNNVIKATLTARNTSRVETITAGYNKENQLTHQTVENGDVDLTTTWTVDDRGHVVATLDPRGHVSGADPAAFTSSYRYDQTGRLVEAKAPEVQIDKDGNSQPGQPTTRYGYDGAGQPTHVTDAEGRTTVTSYDRVGRVTAVAAPSYTPPGGTIVTPTTRYGYDAAGRLTTITSPRGRTSTAEYDALGRQVRTTDPGVGGQSPGQWVTEYTLLGEPLTVIDPTGARTEATYDDLGRNITYTQIERQPTAQAITTRREYNDAGHLIKEVQPGNKVTGFTPNAAGEVITYTDPLTWTLNTEYDLAGRVTKETDPLGYATTYQYDLAGRLTALKDLDSAGTVRRTRTYAYDAASNLISSTSGEGHITKATYDASNALIELLEPLSDGQSIRTTFGYDALGAPTRSTDGRGNSVWTSYNSLGLVESVVEPATAAHPDLADRTWTHIYDADGNLTALAQPGGVRIDHTLDELGRVTRTSGSGQQVTNAERTFSYDLAGHRTAIGDYSLKYNDRGLLTTVERAGSQVAAFSYDPVGNPLTRADASGTATFTWDANDRLKTAADPVSGRNFTYGYDKNNRLTALTSANPVNNQTFTYDALSRLETHTVTASGGTQLAKITYGWDKDDKLLSKSTTGTAGAGVNSYDYDHAGRLISWTAPNGNVTTYTWDAAGNRTKIGDKTFNYDERNRLTSGAGSDYTYTPRGTLATKSSQGTTQTLVFDAFDRLISDGATTYTYDALDRLTTRKSGAAEQRFVYSGLENDIVSVTNAAGTVQARYGRDPAGGLLSLQEGTDPALGVLTDLHSDVIGTFTGTALVDSTAYSPLGEVIAQTGTKRTLGYQGEYTDPETGKVNMQARWYEPGIGGFVSRDSWTLDPSPSIQLNRYAYANGDPLTGQDPSGHKCVLSVAQYGGPLATGTYGSAPTYAAAAACAGGGRGAGVGVGNGRSTGGGTGNYGGGGGTGAGGVKPPSRAGSACTKPKKCDDDDEPAARDHCSDERYEGKPGCYGNYDGSNQYCKKNPNSPNCKAKKQDSKPNCKKNPNAKGCKKQDTRTYCEKYPRADRCNKTTTSTQTKCQKNPYAAGCPKAEKTNKCKRNPRAHGCKKADPQGNRCPKPSTRTCRKGSDSSDPGKKRKEEEKKKEEHDSTEPIEIHEGNIATAYDDGHNWRRDLVEDILDETVDDLVEEVLDEIAPNLPPGPLLPGGGSCAPGGNSFVPGTRVLMADGSHKRIDRIKVGEHVLAVDPVSGDSGAMPVTTLITGYGTKRLVKITVDLDGPVGIATDSLTATDNHPFWVPALHQWVEAGVLQPGTWLQTAAGTYVQVTAVQAWTTVQRVYNLTVDALHTYHVVAGDQAVLVHNDRPSPKDYIDGDLPEVGQSALYALWNTSPAASEGDQFLKWGVWTRTRSSYYRYPAKLHERERFRMQILNSYDSKADAHAAERYLVRRVPGPWNEEKGLAGTIPTDKTREEVYRDVQRGLCFDD